MIRGEVTGRKAGCRGYDASRRLALSIPEFCAAHGFSEGMYYKMRKQGLTPREMKVGTRTLITFEAAAKWRVEREAASTVEHKTRRAPPVKTAHDPERGMAR
jgi:predicted DNA-binding transcriptional regulator AlpA